MRYPWMAMMGVLACRLLRGVSLGHVSITFRQVFLRPAQRSVHTLTLLTITGAWRSCYVGPCSTPSHGRSSLWPVATYLNRSMNLYFVVRWCGHRECDIVAGGSHDGAMARFQRRILFGHNPFSSPSIQYFAVRSYFLVAKV
jgi:hypothetical protein